MASPSPEDPIPLLKVYMSEDAIRDVGNTLKSGWVTQGPKVKEFESELSKYLGNDMCVTVNSCTSGLELIFYMLKNSGGWGGSWPGFQQGDAVLACPLTCRATNWCIQHNGWRYKWVDCDPSTCNMDLNDLRRKISPSTKVILLVHWGGAPVDLDAVKEIQEECYQNHGFRPVVVEDAAHAFGARYNGKMIGAHGNVTVFSFQAVKHLTCVDGGLICFPTAAEYERAKLLRWFGINREERNAYGGLPNEVDVLEAGFKYHMNDVNATIGLANFRHFEKEVLSKHRDNAQHYDQAFSCLKSVAPMRIPLGVESARWMYTLRVWRKPDFIEHMRKRGIHSFQIHGRNDDNTCALVPGHKLVDLKGVTQACSEVCDVPVGWWITAEQRAYIVAAILDWERCYEEAAQKCKL